MNGIFAISAHAYMQTDVLHAKVSVFSLAGKVSAISALKKLKHTDEKTKCRFQRQEM